LYRDITAIVPFVIQFLMLASPVAYSSTLVPRRWQALYHLNPIADVIDGFRWSVTGRGHGPGAMIFVAAGVVALVLVGGLMFFQRVEGTVVDRV
jgi:lipopolysaccharide transport system permease protein